MKTGISCARLAVLPLALVSAFASFAQTPTPSLGETVVTASRIEQPVTDVVADVSIMDRAQIERMGATTVPQLLSRLPGLQAISFGDASRVYIRGADSRMTALYVDGVRVDSQDGASLLGGGVPWELVPVSQIDRIEVLRGPASAVYGSDAMGGVIQIFTRRGEAGFTPYVNFGVGSFNLKKINAGVSGAQGGWDYALGLGLEETDGFNTRPDLVHTPDHEASTNRTASLRLGYQIASAHRVELMALDSQLDSHYVPWFGGTDFNAKGNLTTSALKWKAKWTEAYSTSLTLSRSEVAKRDDVPFDFKTTLQGILFENNLRIGTGTVSAVLEQKKDTFDAKPSGYGDPAFQGERTQNAVALGYGASYGLHSVQLNVRNDRESLFGSHQTGAAAYGYAFAPQWRATISTGTAFRAPTLEQIYGPYGSTQLAPETNRSHEIGVSYADASQSYKAVFYRNAVENMISSSATLATCAAGFFCYFNVGQASIRGVTFSGTHHFTNYDVRGSIDILDPRDDVTGRTLSLRALRTLSLGVDRRLAGWLLGAEVQAVGERFNDAANTKVLPGYALLNLSANTQLNKDWRLVTRLDNATDTQYQQVDKYATPGRTFFVGFQWQPQH
ncbi:MAG: TonB-dependent receptor [Pseudomonadota bacterium]